MDEENYLNIELFYIDLKKEKEIKLLDIKTKQFKLLSEMEECGKKCAIELKEFDYRNKLWLEYIVVRKEYLSSKDLSNALDVKKVNEKEEIMTQD